MSELGALLEVVHGAHRSFGSVRLEAREWRHNHRLQEAYERAAQQARGGGMSVRSALRGDEDLPAETEVRVRAWFGQPNRVREERDEAGHRYLAVADGTRWWQRLPGWATMSDTGDGWQDGHVGHTLRPLLDPWPVVAGLELVAAGSTRVARREGAVLRATARPHPHGFDAGGLLAYGADRHELVVDRERGTLLRAASLLGDAEFTSVELLTVAFDEPLDPRVFRFEPEPGEAVARPDEVSPGAVTLEEAARRAAFTVLVPRSLGHGWRSHVLYTPGREGTPVREAVQLMLYRDDASHTVSIRQTAGPWESWQTNGTEATERDGRALRLSVGPWRRVLLEERGTFVELDSQTIENDALVALALALEPAATEPPPLLA